MATATAPGTGLLVILDLAGQRVTALEDRVTALEEELAAERQVRATVEALLSQARAAAPTPPPSPR